MRAAIGDLAGLLAGSLGLPELLAEVSPFAVHAIPGADDAGVTLLRVDRAGNMVEALAASAAFVAEIDEIQYVTLKEGPCFTAALVAAHGAVRVVGWGDGWAAWACTVHSSRRCAVGSRDGGDQCLRPRQRRRRSRAAEVEELSAKPAAVATHNAQILAHALALTAQLRTALPGEEKRGW